MIVCVLLLLVCPSLSLLPPPLPPLPSEFEEKASFRFNQDGSPNEAFQLKLAGELSDLLDEKITRPATVTPPSTQPPTQKTTRFFGPPAIQKPISLEASAILSSKFSTVPLVQSSKFSTVPLDQSAIGKPLDTVAIQPDDVIDDITGGSIEKIDIDIEEEKEKEKEKVEEKEEGRGGEEKKEEKDEKATTPRKAVDLTIRRTTMAPRSQAETPRLKVAATPLISESPRFIQIIEDMLRAEEEKEQGREVSIGEITRNEPQLTRGEFRPRTRVERPEKAENENFVLKSSKFLGPVGSFRKIQKGVVLVKRRRTGRTSHRSHQTERDQTSREDERPRVAESDDRRHQIRITKVRRVLNRRPRSNYSKSLTQLSLEQ